MTLVDGSIYSLKNICEAFTIHFTTRKRQPTIMAMLSGITQGNKKTMQGYIYYFTKVAVVVGCIDEKLKCLIFEKGLRPDCMFRKNLGLKESHGLKDLLSRKKRYINHIAKLLAEGGDREVENPITKLGT